MLTGELKKSQLSTLNPKAEPFNPIRLGEFESTNVDGDFVNSSPRATSSTSPTDIIITAPPSATSPTSPTETVIKPKPEDQALRSLTPSLSLPFSPPNLSSSKGKNKALRRRQALDLFSGTGSVACRLRGLGYEVISLDIDPRTNPTLCMDILQWRHQDYPPAHLE